MKSTVLKSHVQFHSSTQELEDLETIKIKNVPIQKEFLTKGNYIIEVGGDENKPQVIRTMDEINERLNFDSRRKKFELAINYLSLGIPVEPMLDMVMASYAAPNELEKKLNLLLAEYNTKCLVLGTIEDRIFIFYKPDHTAIFVSLGLPLNTLMQPLLPLVSFTDLYNEANILGGNISTAFIDRVRKPKVVLASLYHPEVFPLPRVALGISSIARALRKELIGQVHLFDMQLDMNVTELYQQLVSHKPDVIGISVTFGQQDILDKLLVMIYRDNLQHQTKILLGGSLPTLNQKVLLDKYPYLIIGISSGESTLVDVVKAHWGEINKNEIAGISYIDNGQLISTSTKSNRESFEMLPELDLLLPTLKKNGVMQLESSRGCSYACSFCPRTHKGVWAGDSPIALKLIMPYISDLFDRNPHISRKIFLVDEEFVGYNRDSENRIRGVSKVLASFNFKYETSSRIDQIYRPNKTFSWHIKRIKLWREIRRLSLERCLFGIESGVDTILKRFNKKTTVAQNVLGIRLLTASAIPVRFTYITFDQLMTMQELIDTYTYLGRTDLILKPLNDLDENAIFHIAHDEELVAKYSLNRPFYEDVSYMLVTMENLTNSPYTKLVQEQNLETNVNTQMGRIDAKFMVPEIGFFSYYSQCWVDRSFAIDYALKSVQKYSNSKIRSCIHELRKIMRRYSYELLGQFLYLETAQDDLLPPTLTETLKIKLKVLQLVWHKQLNNQQKAIEDLMDNHINRLMSEYDNVFEQLLIILPPNDYKLLYKETLNWKQKKGWGLINGSNL